MKAIKPIEQESNLDFYKGLVKRIIKNWYFFVISFVIFIGFGHYIVKSSSRLFDNELLMLIQQYNPMRDQNSGNLELIQMFNLQSTIEDELGIVKSFPVVFEAIKQLNLSVSYYIGDGLINAEIYNDSPFAVSFDPNSNLPVDVEFEIKNLTTENFTIEAFAEGEIYFYNFLNDTITGFTNKIRISQKCNVGQEVKIGNGHFKILLNPNFKSDKYAGQKFVFKFNNLKKMTYHYQAYLIVERISAESSLVMLSFKAGNPKLVTDFLNTLSRVFLNRNLDKKNKIADKTIAFIDRQITGIADTLGLTADQLKDFRVRNDVMDINYMSQSLYQQMVTLKTQKDELMVASKYYDYIKEYFENNKDLTDLLAPSAMGVEDLQLQSLITQLTDKNKLRSFQLDSKSPNNPTIPVLNAEINNLKTLILENIEYIVATSNITINDINNRIAQLNSQVKNLPGIEKELTNIEREFHVNDAIYTYLLSTRAEAEVARASNSPDYEVVDPAKLSSSKMVAPKMNMIYLSSFFLGIMAPVGIIMLISFFKNSIDDKHELEKISHFPIIGTIARNEKKSLLPMLDYPKSLISESFRSARTSMQFFQKGKPKQRILVTSSMSGDGKSFIAMNLGASYSNYGKRTLLLEFDLRNPKLDEYFGLQKTKGLSSYLINDARLEDIILKTSIKNLDIICAGEIPPNPLELIASENTRNLIEILQNIYDFIIIDTPPIGVVTDSYLLMEFSDANLFVVRLNYTNKRFFTSLIKDIEQKEIPNIGIIVNEDAERTSSVYYSDNIVKISYFRSKFNTLKSLLGIKQKDV